MALKNIFNAKARAENEKNKRFLSSLLYMAIADDKLDQSEFFMIQEIMLKRGMSREETAAEVKKLLKKGGETELKKPETDQEKQEFLIYLTSVMLMDHKIDPDEFAFVTMMVRMMYEVDEPTAQQMVRKVTQQLIDTGSFYVEE